MVRPRIVGTILEENVYQNCLVGQIWYVPELHNSGTF